jgi:hypothetical protein
VCLVILTLLTLIVLKGYAEDTNKIANAGVLQLENSQMPFLAVAMREGTPAQEGGWEIENQGFGAAINISYSEYREDGKHMRSTPPLGRGAKRHNLHNVIVAALAQREGFEIEYESLSGLKYRTTFRTEGGDTKTRFYKPATGGA